MAEFGAPGRGDAAADAGVSIWMPLYLGDYLSRTLSLATAEHGAYFLLRFEYWMNRGFLPDDDHYLRKTTRAEEAVWPALRATVLERYFTRVPIADVVCDVTWIVTLHTATHVWRHEELDKQLAAAIANRRAQFDRTAKATAARKKKQRKRDGNADGERHELRDESRDGALGPDVTLSTSTSPSSLVGGKPPTTPSAGAPGGNAPDGIPTGDLRGRRGRRPASPGAKTSIELADRDMPLPDWLAPHAEAWAAFQEIRWLKHPRQPFTARAQRQLVSKLEAMHRAGEDLAAVINNSVTAGWSDLYPPRSQQVHAGNQPARRAESRADARAAVMAELTGRRNSTLEDHDVIDTVARPVH